MSFLRDSRNDINEVSIAYSSQVLRERVRINRIETSFNSKSNSNAVDHLPSIYKVKRKSGRNCW